MLLVNLGSHCHHRDNDLKITFEKIGLYHGFEIKFMVDFMRFDIYGSGLGFRIDWDEEELFDWCRKHCVGKYGEFEGLMFFENEEDSKKFKEIYGN